MQVFALTNPVAMPSVWIARFQGDRAAAISYTFDDGLRDQYTCAVPMLNEVGFKGTFFVIPSKVSTTVEDAERRKNDKRAWGTITWDELRQMAAQGHEIGSHTWSHPNLTKLTAEQVDAELTTSYNAIKKEIGRAPLTLAYPFNAHNPEVDTNTLKYYVAFRAYQIGTSGKTTAASLNDWADKLVKEKKWGVVMTHAITNGYAAMNSPDVLLDHWKYVKSHHRDIWVDTFANIARYEKEREATKLVITGKEGDLSCRLTCALDPQLYNVPLTIVISAPGATTANAERAGEKLPVRIVDGSIQVDAAPGEAPINITWH